MDVPKASKYCSVSQREFQSGESFFSVLSEKNNVRQRTDYAAEHWNAPPETLPENWCGWWQTKQPVIAEKKVQLAPNNVLLELFEQLLLQPESNMLRYVLTLLLIRRRVFRYERDETDKKGQNIIIVFNIKSGAMYEIPVAMPEPEKLETIQKQLSEMLYS